MSVVQKNSVSFRVGNIKLRPNEEVIGFEIEVAGGAFEGLSSLPKGWQLAINNKSASLTKLDADLSFGTERMNVQEVERIVLTVTEFDGAAPKLTGYLVVTNTASERHHSLSSQNFIRQ